MWKRIASLVSISLLVPLSAASQTHPGITQQSPPSVYRFMVGDVRVSALSDGSVPIDLHKLLQDITAEQIDKLLARSFLTNPYEASITAFLVETAGHKVLVDTGAGELFGPGKGGRLLQTLHTAGVEASQITDILLTHVHADHSGGLALGGKVSFPNATIHVGKPDVDFFLDRTNAAKTGYDIHYFDEADKTLRPCVDAGKVMPFSGRSEVVPGIVGELHPGHTPGAAFYELRSRGKSLVFIGDTIHADPVQFPEPRVTISFDQDPNKAREVRLSAFAQFAAAGTLIAAPHLPFPGVGHVRAEGSGYRFYPIEYSDRTVRSN